MPDLPTMSEAALPGFNAVAWFGLVGPAGMPQQAVATLHAATLASLGMPEVKERLFNSGVEVRTSSPREFADFIATEMQKWAQIVKAAGARVD
jgi:tripartite-type tricarboxylate transporter receptor subunit TctC